MEALALWFVGVVSAYPAGILILTIIGSAVVIATILVPVIVKLTPTDKDDKLWAKIESNPIFKVVSAVVSRFSVYTPPTKKP